MAGNLMIQGTMSNAGKSILTAGILRVLKQDGYRVAPFKSQNMALNSYITDEGFEMGRAQVMQAEAAGLAPSVLMNPILLKPTSDVGSQVIVNGIPRGDMPAKAYFQYKTQLIPDILAAYHTLAAQYDAIIIEGAGSPAEINLKQQDIVNMGLAKLVDAPVLLVGDIDRGGVFAQLVGTIMLLEQEERARVKGLIINKFRGDAGILTPGLKQLVDICGIPVAGVVPYMQLDLEDEDSLSERLQTQGSMDAERTGMRDGADASLLDIAVIRLPHISNFTDFNALQMRQDVRLRYVSAPQHIGHPDLIVIPGTKNTIDDLKWMRRNGMEAVIRKLAAAQTFIFGICGGFQMMGRHILDSCHAETGESIEGMGLLPIDTQFRQEKSRTQVQAEIAAAAGAFQSLKGLTADGYEIHMGESRIYSDTRKASAFAAVKNKLDGSSYPDGCVCENAAGTYLHGIFDAGTFTEGLLRLLGEKKGLLPESGKEYSYAQHKQQEYDKLAAVIREYLDMRSIYRMLGLR